MILSLLLGCSPDPLLASIQLAEGVSTVVELSLDEDLSSLDEAWVVFGAVDGSSRRLGLPLSGPQAGRLDLVGFKPETAVQVQVFALDGGRELQSELLRIDTGSVPAWLPTLYVESDDGAPHFDGGTLLTSIVTSPPAAVLIDADGDYLWWTELGETRQVARVRLSRDGLGVVALPVNMGEESLRGLIFAPWDGGEQVDTDVGTPHHDFVVLEDGTLGLIYPDRRMVDGQELSGDVLVERSVDGSEVEIWNAWDQLDPAVDLPTLEDEGAWTHANHLLYDAVADEWLLGLHGIRSIVRLARDGSGIQTMLGGARSDYRDGDGQPIELLGHHAFELTDSGIVLFENGAGEDPTSRLLELSLDEASGLAEQVWEYRPQPELYNFALGGVDRLEGGDTVTTFSVNGRIDEVAPDGSLRWRLSAGLGGTFGYVEVVRLPGQD